jgi:hypothetical protein
MVVLYIGLGLGLTVWGGVALLYLGAWLHGHWLVRRGICKECERYRILLQVCQGKRLLGERAYPIPEKPAAEHLCIERDRFVPPAAAKEEE